MSKIIQCVSLIGIFLLYSLTGIFTKAASEYVFMSWPYLLWIGGTICILGVYAILWQQIISRIPVSEAYMFKGTSLVFVLILSHLIFGEAITWTNILGAIIIVGGIALYAKA